MARSLKKSPKMGFKRSMSRVHRTRSPSLKTHPNIDSIERDQRIEFLGGSSGGSGSGRGSGSGGEDEIETSFSTSDNISEEEETGESVNRVMVVIDSELASKGALDWALSHTIQPQDTILLLYVGRPSKQGKKTDGKHNLKANQVLHSLKNLCETKRPGVQVEIRAVEGKDKDKGPMIVEEAKQQQVALLVLGQKKKPLVWRLFKRWSWKRGRGGGRGRGVVEYCIQNAVCMTIAVRRKSSQHGGYLITTKRHKSFWLLA